MSLTAIAINAISANVLLDNRVLGLAAGRILAAMRGGRVEGGGNKPIVYVKPDGTKCSVGTGDIRSAFISSSCKGVGRNGRELKVPHAKVFIHLELTRNDIRIKEYTKDEVLAMI